MSRKGGYLIVDLSKGLDSVEHTSYIYNQLQNTKHKVVLVSGFTIDDINYEDTWCNLTSENDGYYMVLTSNLFTIHIGYDEWYASKGQQLKLAATGRHLNYQTFELDNTLDNKIYYIDYYSNETGFSYSTIVSLYRQAIIGGANLTNSETSVFGLSLNEDTISLFPVIPNDDPPLITKQDIIYVYELPFII